MDTKTSKNEQNEEEEFFCEKCDYKCFKKYNYDRHVLTDKHTKIHSKKARYTSIHSIRCLK